MEIKFKAKYIINFDITCKTGLHIGGGDTGSGIGDIDNPVIKDPMTQLPIIAGSSLKGRMRERLEWVTDNIKNRVNKLREEEDKKFKEKFGDKYTPDDLRKKEEDLKIKILKIGQCTCGKCDVCRYFGHSNNDEGSVLAPTRFIFRDAFPKKNGEYDQIKNWEQTLGSKKYTEEKFENTISRITAEANPRQMERVPAGSVFHGEAIIDLYDFNGIENHENDNVQSALKLLFQGFFAIENSFLGGGGSRGSGQVEFNNFKIVKHDASYYRDPKVSPQEYPLDKSLNACQIFKTNVYETIAK